ncbi:uncharacterized protein ACBT57_017349 isoform 1-T1 [Dama dama]|uniref:uncharacterized protein LOC133063717 n=1 Tax=Dama dama TaxID=30532 RepID=UPI002A361B2D|nr:uncharacterized protein LOC133063717 [Dama dama]
MLCSMPGEQPAADNLPRSPLPRRPHTRDRARNLPWRDSCCLLSGVTQEAEEGAAPRTDAGGAGKGYPGAELGLTGTRGQSCCHLARGLPWVSATGVGSAPQSQGPPHKSQSITGLEALIDYGPSSLGNRPTLSKWQSQLRKDGWIRVGDRRSCGAEAAAGVVRQLQAPRVKRLAPGSIMQTNEHREVKAPTCLFLLRTVPSVGRQSTRLHHSGLPAAPERIGPRER